MLFETIRIWRNDSSEECEAPASFDFRNVALIQDYTLDDDFFNDKPKSYVLFTNGVSIIVLEDYLTLKEDWYQDNNTWNFKYFNN